jgi:hypothetical protein
MILVRRLSFLAVLAAMWLAGGCDSMRQLHQMFHEEPEKAAADMGTASLRVIVDPSDQLNILLDGYQVGTTSPYVGKGLKPGSHVLSVRAPGYITFNLPVTLKDGQLLEIPIALRPVEPQAAP